MDPAERPTVSHPNAPPVSPAAVPPVNVPAPPSADVDRSVSETTRFRVVSLHASGGMGNVFVAQPRVSEARKVQAARGFFRRYGIGRGTAGLEHTERRCAIKLAGVEMRETEPLGKPAGERALARCRRPVDRDDQRVVRHPISGKPAPRRFNSGTKPGKLVAIGRASSISTGDVAARPMTRNAIAMR